KNSLLSKPYISTPIIVGKTIPITSKIATTATSFLFAFVLLKLYMNFTLLFFSPAFLFWSQFSIFLDPLIGQSRCFCSRKPFNIYCMFYSITFYQIIQVL